MLTLCVIAALRTGLFRAKPFVVLGGFSIFILWGAILTSVGRMNPDDPNYIAAKAQRYITLPILNWAAAVLLLIWLSSKLRWRIVSPLSITSIIAVFLVFLFPKLRPWIHGVESYYSHVQWAELSLDSGLTDPEMIRLVYPDAHLVIGWLPLLKAGNLSIYYNGPQRLLGTLASSNFKINSGAARTGEISYIWPAMGGLEVEGWVDASANSQDLLLVNEEGAVAGFGRKLPTGLPGQLPQSPLLTRLGWAGFTNNRFPGRRIQAYAIDQTGKQLTPVGSPFTVPSNLMLLAGPNQIGRAIGNVSWKMDSGWKQNALPPGVNAGSTAFQIFFSSWVHSDGDTGAIHSEAFDVPAGHCLILPVVHGPTSSQLSVEVQNGSNGSLVARVPMRDADTQWLFWRLDVPKDINTVSIVATDDGPSWGQWVAIGPPAECR